MRILEGTYPLSFPSSKSCKLSNMNIEILCIHEDYVTKTFFTLMLLNGLLVLVIPNFKNRQEKCRMKNGMFFGRVFERLRGIDMAHRTVSLQKFILEIHLRAAIDRFLRSLLLNKPFSTISDSANQALEPVAKYLRKTGNIASLIEPIRINFQ